MAVIPSQALDGNAIGPVCNGSAMPTDHSEGDIVERDERAADEVDD